MDVARQVNVGARRLRRALGIAVEVLAVAGAAVWLSRLQQAAPVVEGSTIWVDEVRRGPMLRQVRGIGTLVPENIRWIPAASAGRVERILLRPGTTVAPETIVLELSNPELEQAVEDAQLKLQAAHASLDSLRVQLENELLQQRASAAAIDAEYRKAEMAAEMNQTLADRQLVSQLVLRQSTLDAEQLRQRDAIARQQLDIRAASSRTQLLVLSSRRSIRRGRCLP